MRHCATSRKVPTRLTRIMIMLAFIPSYCIITAALAQIFEAEKLVKFPLVLETTAIFTNAR